MIVEKLPIKTAHQWKPPLTHTPLHGLGAPTPTQGSNTSWKAWNLGTDPGKIWNFTLNPGIVSGWLEHSVVFFFLRPQCNCKLDCFVSMVSSLRFAKNLLDFVSFVAKESEI